MERRVPEEFTGSNDHTQIVKGKRTKRQRPQSPFAMALASSSSTGRGGGGGEGDVYFSSPSPTTSGEISTSSVEDEDMANCLILLAQGSCPAQLEEGIKIEKFSSRRFAEMSTTTTGKAGFYVYECKTCNRTFPSFQALGGHRASHKKPKAPKATVEETKFLTLPLNEREERKFLTPPLSEKEGQFNKISPSFPFQIANNKPKVHECSICGSEFSSGQALGGHMRRHRTHTNSRIAMSNDTSTIESTHESEKPRNILPLDLNLPAPEEDRRDSNFPFTPKQQHLVFSAPALVGCHY